MGQDFKSYLRLFLKIKKVPSKLLGTSNISNDLRAYRYKLERLHTNYLENKFLLDLLCNA